MSPLNSTTAYSKSQSYYAHEWALSTASHRRRSMMMLVLGIHIVLVFFLTQWHPANQQSKRTENSLLMQWLPTPTVHEKSEAPKTDVRKRQQLRESIRQQPSASAAKSEVPINPITENVSKESTQPQPNVTSSDPFAASTPSITEKLRSDAGKAFKQVEAEQPIKRWLLTKKELTPMEKFARDALGATPAREIQTQEEMRPDGSRMTRVKTPRGEFCVVGPPPGRPYDIKGPEHRVMSCPIYF